MASLNEWRDILDRLESDINAPEDIIIEYPDMFKVVVDRPSMLPVLQGTVLTHGASGVYLLRENGTWVSACTCKNNNGVYTAEEFFKYLLTLDPRLPFKVIHS